MIPQIVAVVNKLLVTRGDQDRAALRSYGAIRETARLERSGASSNGRRAKDSAFLRDPHTSLMTYFNFCPDSAPGSFDLASRSHRGGRFALIDPGPLTDTRHRRRIDEP